MERDNHKPIRNKNILILIVFCLLLLLLKYVFVCRSFKKGVVLLSCFEGDKRKREAVRRGYKGRGGDRERERKGDREQEEVQRKGVKQEGRVILKQARLEKERNDREKSGREGRDA